MGRLWHSQAVADTSFQLLSVAQLVLRLFCRRRVDVIKDLMWRESLDLVKSSEEFGLVHTASSRMASVCFHQLTDCISS